MKRYLTTISKYSEYEAEILEYGLKVIVINSSSIFILLFLSYLLGDLLFGSLFVVSFSCIRFLIGGFHCKTIYKCLTSYISLFLFAFILSNQIIYQLFLHIVFIPCILYLSYRVCSEYKGRRVYYIITALYLIISLICYINYYIPIISGLWMGVLLRLIKK